MKHTKYIAVFLLISLRMTTSVPAKNMARPVIEVINEQSRMDEKIRQNNAQSHLPYGNPLAGNSKQNARLHAQNQQAMFNAEKVRQHRAQLQRWTKAPPQVDSYMKAFHESHENHHLALEQQLTKQRDNRQTKQTFPALHVTLPTPKAKDNPRIEGKNLRHDNPKRVQSHKNSEPTKITRADAIIKYEKNRNHRSYGSIEYQQYLQPKRYQTVYVSPAPTYDQGVTIKPNGNVGLTTQKPQEELKLYTEAIPSKTQYVYPKQYSQMQAYESAQDIDSLQTLLNKKPTEQLSELNALLNSGSKDSLNTPIDLYFYMKDPQASLHQNYEHTHYIQEPNDASAYLPEIPKDHKPIHEEIDDIEDPNKHRRPKIYGVQPILATQAEGTVETTTTKSNNYYKVEVASQTISAPYNSYKHYYKEENPKPSNQEIQYVHYPVHYTKETTTERDLSEKYLHHNAHNIGVQHLTEDGTGISAYGDENLQYAANYEFGYRVRDQHSGNDFGHHEAKRGHETSGRYHVLLPDGRIQKVKYSAGPEGFHADISYDHLQ